jgi:signal transduction histidine kinase/ligand-binding sensor domain-containing protein
MTFRVFFIVALSTFVAMHVQAQSFGFEHLGTSHGLSQNSALCMLQDQQGFLWIGTQHGLNRFDGYSFVTYYHDPLDSTTIADNYVVGLAEDTQHRLWASFLTGAVDVFDKRSGKFEHLQINTRRLTTPGIPVAAALFRSRVGGIWMGFQTGKLLHLAPELMHLPPQELFDSAATRTIRLTDAVQSVFEDSKGNIWIGGLTTLSRLVRDSNDAQTLQVIRGTWKTGSVVYGLHEARTQPGFLWVGTQEGLRLFDARRDAFVSWESRIGSNRLLLTEPIWSIAEIAPGILWIATTKQGLFEVDVNRRRITHHPHNPDNPSGVGDNWVTSILADRSGVAWLGLLTGGISKTLRDSYPFHFVGYDPHNQHGLRDHDVTAILEDRSRVLWVGTRKGGLHRSLVPTGTEAFRFRQYPTVRDDPRHLPDPYVKAIHEDRRGSLWVGLWATPGGLFRADAQREFFARFSHDSLNPNSLASNLVRVIRDDAEGYLWIGMTGGLSRIHLDSLSSATFYNYPSRGLPTNSLSQDDVFSLLISERKKEKEVWVGTYAGGVNRLDPQKGEFTHYRHDPAATHYICSDRITTVYEDRRGNIWAGTLIGLAWLDRQGDGTARFECFGEEDGLLHNHALAILEDDHGRIWISTLGGLSRFDPSTRRFTNFYSGIHLPITEFNVNAASTGANGRMYFGGVNGFIHFHPDSIRIQNEPPSVVITSLKVFEKEVRLDTSIILKKEVRLSHDEDFLSFEFAALDFREPARNRYAYKMEGLNSEWVHIGNRRYVSFSNLEPKEYTLRVKASNNDGVWNEEGTALRIVIEPPFWMTAWFRILAGVWIVGAVVGGVRYFSTRKLRKQVEELERQKTIQRERERISRELHDSVGSSLVGLVSGLELATKFTKSGTTKTGKLLSSLHDDARAGIGLLRETIWALSTNRMPWQKFVTALEQHLGAIVKYRKTPKLQFSMKESGEITLTPIQSLNLLRIAQEAVTNSLKHAHAKKVFVELSVLAHSITLTVTDDGEGMVMDAAGDTDSRGLANMKSRAEELGGSFAIKSAKGVGTAITVVVPIDRT